jgi:hypothetical protein
MGPFAHANTTIEEPGPDRNQSRTVESGTTYIRCWKSNEPISFIAESEKNPLEPLSVEKVKK